MKGTNIVAHGNRLPVSLVNLFEPMMVHACRAGGKAPEAGSEVMRMAWRERAYTWKALQPLKALSLTLMEKEVR